MGDKARALNELVSYEELREYIDYDEGKEMSNLDYLHKTQEITRHKSEYREKILREHPLLSNKYRYYTENQIRYGAAYGLMQRRFSVDRNKQEQLEKGFMAYVDSAFYPNPRKAVYASQRLFFFYERLYRIYRRYPAAIQSERKSDTTGIGKNLF